MPTAKAVIVNRSGITQHLHAMIGGKMDGITVPPNTHGKPLQVDAHFVLWQPPPRNKIHVLYFIDQSGKQVDKLTDDQLPDARNPEKIITVASVTATPTVQPSAPITNNSTASATPSNDQLTEQSKT